MENILPLAQLKHALKLLIIEECDKDVEAEDIADDEILFDCDLDLDSLDALQICMAVKSKYGVRIEGGPDARKALQSITTLAQTIVEHQV
ncbi:Acyl carrier protein [Zhongshania aliphaticivorans]|uniref:Acyl carrier protein n=1 Tax=Zhongshania aliphaticivorans TaxID=1470434 RepID=A0A5S9PPP8_9GAMM|nr:phosphopantetheine-binding protein [Zhongshania aliphaticivorans]CAA0106475.1 Acyl carrier protein [Zhongshania aliphaticivorans]CAA0106616.1 Acyl carrier protein [Zhongshania aliphaticivorans]